MFDMTWQHTFLFFEILASAAILSLMIERGYYQRRPLQNALIAVWDAVMIGFMLTGARELTWQIVVLVAIYFLNTSVGFARGLKNERADLTKTGHLGPWLFTIFLLLLLVTGQPG